MIQLKQNKLLIVLCMLLGCKQQSSISSMPFINKPDFTPEWIATDDKKYDSIHHIPAFSFIDQNGQSVTEKTVEGKIYVADFFFTRCASICPKMTANLLLVQAHFKNDKNVMILSHSVTPDLDSVSVLKKYANTRGVIDNGKWRLLTGKQDDIYRLAKKEYYAGDTIGYYQTGNEFLHTENVILIDRKRRIRGVYNGTLQVEMERLIEDIETLNKEEE